VLSAMNYTFLNAKQLLTSEIQLCGEVKSLTRTRVAQYDSRHILGKSQRLLRLNLTGSHDNGTVHWGKVRISVSVRLLSSCKEYGNKIEGEKRVKEAVGKREKFLLKSFQESSENRLLSMHPSFLFFG